MIDMHEFEDGYFPGEIVEGCCCDSNGERTCVLLRYTGDGYIQPVNDLESIYVPIFMLLETKSELVGTFLNMEITRLEHSPI